MRFIVSFLFIELGVGKIDPDPGRHIAAVVAAFADLGGVVDFDDALFLALFPGKLDDFRPPFLGFQVAVRAESAFSQSIGGLITFRAEH